MIFFACFLVIAYILALDVAGVVLFRYGISNLKERYILFGIALLIFGVIFLGIGSGLTLSLFTIGLKV